MPNNDATDQNLHFAQGMQASEARERGEPILTAKEVHRIVIDTTPITARAANTITQWADALEHVSDCRATINSTMRRACPDCDAARELLRRFREGS